MDIFSWNFGIKFLLGNILVKDLDILGCEIFMEFFFGFSGENQRDCHRNRAKISLFPLQYKVQAIL